MKRQTYCDVFACDGLLERYNQYSNDDLLKVIAYSEKNPFNCLYTFVDIGIIGEIMRKRKKNRRQ